MAGERHSDTAYRAIEDMIIRRVLEPGSLTSEAELIEATGIGRTPVREALQRLALNRMVEIHPNKGVLVPPISVEAELKSLEARRVLEALAVRLGCTRATEGQRVQMKDAVHAIRVTHGSLDEYMPTVKATHELIACCAHNDVIADALAPLQGLSRRFWLAHVTDAKKEVRLAAAHHTAILRAILASDEDAAQRASEGLNDYLVSFSRATVGCAATRAVTG